MEESEGDPQPGSPPAHPQPRALPARPSAEAAGVCLGQRVTRLRPLAARPGGTALCSGCRLLLAAEPEPEPAAALVRGWRPERAAPTETRARSRLGPGNARETFWSRGEDSRPRAARAMRDSARRRRGRRAGDQRRSGS